MKKQCRQCVAALSADDAKLCASSALSQSTKDKRDFLLYYMHFFFLLWNLRTWISLRSPSFSQASLSRSLLVTGICFLAAPHAQQLNQQTTPQPPTLSRTPHKDLRELSTYNPASTKIASRTRPAPSRKTNNKNNKGRGAAKPTQEFHCPKVSSCAR